MELDLVEDVGVDQRVAESEFAIAEFAYVPESTPHHLYLPLREMKDERMDNVKPKISPKKVLCG